MRSTATLFICLATFLPCHAQDVVQDLSDMIGISISHPLVNGCIRIDFGHSISRHWTVGAGVSVRLPDTGRTISDEEGMHESILSGLSEDPLKENDCYATMEVNHWPWGTYQKGFITIGCSYGERKGNDCIIGVGYTMRISNRTAVTLRIETRLLNMKDASIGDIISLNMNYIF